mmetsp:Transcript_39923/g.58676  ORF Transcript_39923/g.58676 Transcript_39923/m.58676 type:complete len:1289 (+) Transcript_39923:107-3973(+)|eukprot:CAMPEP_0195525214 /NCGR_PEP_ID=MMETSP0794_2-20130614/25525_1 /TAXON_ID=515487 /ORGANISM="Stephanopyxis turris, Strain CCMP 815" /LENGTH=1288 /DNA_ID=CAMNT_0040655615 /DNA_START=100 /DNA_END=3966 /DNA_ORIENTATION=+
MLTKFESKSARVKGLAFHPVRPWVCASLHNGVIQVWDYRVGTVVDRFEEHDGPVRGVDFHLKEPLLVSGGDDYKVKVWDYKLRRCLFTLLGHLDYIRTVQFHPQPISFPWILSASDDQTLRLWDFHTRSCLSVLTGHNHYVMCASFHSSEDLIVSASLDQTVRVWDTTGLRKKQMGGGDSMGGGSSGIAGMIGANGTGGGGNPALNVQAELFGTNDVVVKYVLEGHDRGVNWAAFHPTLPLLASAADDRQVKLWRMSETKAWEVDTLRGHANNVSCCLFHPKHELIVSNSEDRSIRVWDVSKRVGVQTFRREGDRFWILAAHRTQNLLAAGHDSGMIVFKLDRERPAMCTAGPNKLYYVRGRELFCHDYSRAGNGQSGIDIPITSLRRVGQQSQTDGIGSAPRYVSYNQHNPTEGNILVCSDVDGGCYELVTFSLSHGGGSVTDGKVGSCMGNAIFLGRNRFAVLDRHQRQVIVKNLQNETTKRVQPPVPNVNALMEGGASGRLLLRADDRAILFEVQSRRALGELNAPKLKSVAWSPDGSKVALILKYGIIIADRQLEQLCSISDTVRIKSGSWDVTDSSNSEMFVYTTLNHVKYCLPSGDTGTIRTLDNPIYTTRVVEDEMYCLDREARPKIISIDTTEARFKLALHNKRYGKVMEMVRHSRLCGRVIVAYLQSKGFPEVALHFVREPKTRFSLALACGNIEAAMESAFALEQNQTSPEGSREIWNELGNEALRQGNHQVVEMSYQRTKDFDRLSFLYLLTGDMEKLRKMLKIANMRGDSMARYHNSLMLGDAQERVKVLEETGNLSLAYVCAKMHALEEDAERIQVAIETQEKSVEGLLEKVLSEDPAKKRSGGCLLQPPTPIFRANNWPTLPVQKTTLEDLEAAEAQQNGEPHKETHQTTTNAAQDYPKEEEEDDFGDADLMEDDDLGFGDDDGGWDDDLDDFGDELSPTKAPTDEMMGMQEVLDDSAFQMPPAGRPAAGCWVANSSHAADHLAAGSASSAMQLLNRQIAASDFSVLKTSMIGCYLGATTSLPGIPGSASMNVPIMRNDSNGHPGAESLPRTYLKLKHLVAGVRSGYRAFQGGKFNEAKTAFTDVFTKIPLVVSESKKDANEVKEMLEICREYITAIRIKAAMAECKDPARSTELSAYFTHCNLQPMHLLLALRSAMGTAFKHKNYIVAASFARRLLELPDMNSERNADLRVKATKVLQKSEQMARNEHTLNYNESTSFVIDCKALLPVYNSDVSTKCSFCGSTYAGDSMKNKVCLTCGFSAVGVNTLGLVTGS